MLGDSWLLTHIYERKLNLSRKPWRRVGLCYVVKRWWWACIIESPKHQVLGSFLGFFAQLFYVLFWGVSQKGAGGLWFHCFDLLPQALVSSAPCVHLHCVGSPNRVRAPE
jgi:hypothetical protein